MLRMIPAAQADPAPLSAKAKFAVGAGVP